MLSSTNNLTAPTGRWWIPFSPPNNLTALAFCQFNICTWVFNRTTAIFSFLVVVFMVRREILPNWSWGYSRMINSIRAPSISSLEPKLESIALDQSPTHLCVEPQPPIVNVSKPAINCIPQFPPFWHDEPLKLLLSPSQILFLPRVLITTIQKKPPNTIQNPFAPSIILPIFLDSSIFNPHMPLNWVSPLSLSPSLPKSQIKPIMLWKKKKQQKKPQNNCSSSLSQPLNPKVKQHRGIKEMQCCGVDHT